MSFRIQGTYPTIRHHAARNILNVKHRVTKEPLSLFFVDLEPKENNKDIYDMEFFVSNVLFCVILYSNEVSQHFREMLKLVVCILLRVLGQVQGFRLT
jgi:hypothetical protein